MTVTCLTFWKSEHGENGCEDACAVAADRGLFAVADGVSTTAFAGEWARHLVQQFLTVPLLSADAYELEWWLRNTQSSYPAPDPRTVPAGTLREKAEEGSASTLATLRFTEVNDAEGTAQVLTVGDSCVMIVASSPQPMRTFPQKEGDDFDAHPICLHSRRFDPELTGATTAPVTLRDGDIAVLATDAVARWALAGGGQRHWSRSDALRHIASLRPDQWPDFVTLCRRQKVMADDDSTALVLHFSSRIASLAGTVREPEASGRAELGETTALPRLVKQERQHQLQRAIQGHDSVAIARLAGDVAQNDLDCTGCDLQRVRSDARRTAQGMAAVVAAMNEDACSPEAVRRAWQSQASLLEREPAAARLRRTLIQEGFIADSGAVVGLSGAPTDA